MFLNFCAWPLCADHAGSGSILIRINPQQNYLPPDSTTNAWTILKRSLTLKGLARKASAPSDLAVSSSAGTGDMRMQVLFEKFCFILPKSSKPLISGIFTSQMMMSALLSL